MDFLSSILKIVRRSFYRWTSFLLFKKLSVREVVRLPDGALLCNPDALAEQATIQLTQARVLLYAFEGEGLIHRAADCTTEATILLTQPLEIILDRISDSAERETARRLFSTLKAEPTHQVTYRAAEIYAQSGIDPRLIDPLLVKLAAQELLLYRAYNRGMTLKIDEHIHNDRELLTIVNRFSQRYQRFEVRMQRMLDYIWLKREQNSCRSADLINYLTGENKAQPCGKCDLCSPTYAQLPWNPNVRLYGERLEVDVRQTVLGTIRDHNGVYGRGTIERMLLGSPGVRIDGQMKPLSASARSSDHYEELKDRKISHDHLRRTIDALIEAGLLQLTEKSWINKDQTRNTYQALSLTQKGRDALAAGITLPVTNTSEVPA
jgi:ATP-dependent DNA helicase RecQ